MPAAVARALADRGTGFVFGVPGGGANLDLIEACEDAGVRFVLSRGETAGAIMAAVTAELTGGVGACLATRGPGAASMANGIAHAWLDRCPVLALTDVVPADTRGRVSHQLLDQRRLLGAAAKASCTLGRDGAPLAAEACEQALAPPWGPVHVDIDPSAASEVPARAAPAPPPDSRLLDEARRTLDAARRPLLLAGVGCRGHEDVVRAFATDHDLPVLTTYKAKGLVDEGAANAAGLLTGATIESPVLAEADAILAVGLDPVELIPAAWPYAAPVVAAGPWASSDAYVTARVTLVGDVTEVLDRLSGVADGSGWGDGIRARRRAARDELLLAGDGAGTGLAPHRVVLAARDAFDPGTIATVDAGAHMLPVMELWSVPGPGQALISSGLATMGFALPAAIAAALVRPGRSVVCFTGDGGLGMCLAELETLARLRLPVTVVVLDDACLSLIAIKQRPGGHGGPAAVRHAPVDFAQVARGMGIAARRVDDEAGLRRELARAAGEAAPRLIDAVVDPSSYAGLLSAIRGVRRRPAPGAA